MMRYKIHEKAYPEDFQMFCDTARIIFGEYFDASYKINYEGVARMDVYPKNSLKYNNSTFADRFILRMQGVFVPDDDQCKFHAGGKEKMCDIVAGDTEKLGFNYQKVRREQKKIEKGALEDESMSKAYMQCIKHNLLTK